MTSDELKTAATGFLPGVVVGAAVVWLAMSMSASPMIPVSLDADTTDPEPQAPSEAVVKTAPPTGVSVSANDQPAGRAVIVEKAMLTATSWIAIRDFADGKIGNILGAVRREAGASDDVIVDLLRATVPGSEYAVVVFTDDGDGKFDSKRDTPVMSGDEPYHVTMTATTPVTPNGR